MKNIITVLQIAVALMMSGAILLQAKGVGLGRAWGGGGEFYKSRRGVEKMIFYFTIFTVFLFLLFSFLNLIII